MATALWTSLEEGPGISAEGCVQGLCAEKYKAPVFYITFFAKLAAVSFFSL